MLPLTSKGKIGAAGAARVSCNAAYNTPCSRINSRWLATTIAGKLRVLDTAGYRPEQYLRDITMGERNYETGFYPFVFDKETSVCVAHGAVPDFVGRNISAIFAELGIGLSSASALHGRLVGASNNGGKWVRYLWSDGGKINSKVAFVTNLTERFYLGVGYQDTELPPDVPCSSSHDLWCSIMNVQSLVGSAQALLEKAESLVAFEDAAFHLSFDEEYQVPGGFYIFMYGYDGTLRSHGRLHNLFGASLSDVINKMEQDTNSSHLHRDFIRAADGEKDGWVKYSWRNSPDELEYTKIAYIVKIMFGDQQYYMGSGFKFELGSTMKGPLDIPCTQAYNLPCSFDIASKLSSHALSHAVSSEKAADEIFEDISTGVHTGFAIGDFYLFVYDFNNTCVAHGGNRSFVGKSLSEVFDMVDIDLDANLLHTKFLEAAMAGGGFVQYDWMLPGVDGSHFEKISYLFRFNIGGRDYYSGIGFAHRPAPESIYLERGRTMARSKIPCLHRFGSNCSEINSQSILGRALADLIMATEARVTKSNRRHHTLDQVLADITNRSDVYRVNDFFVAVFAVDKSLCFHGKEYPDRSGCCVAHGANESYVGMTWQDILDSERITSIRGSNLHAELVAQADAGGGWINYIWSENTGVALRKRAWASRFRVNDTKYYVVVEYFNTEVPATCDSCPLDMECLTAEQAFCSHRVQQDPLKIVFITLFGVITPCVALFFWARNRRQKIKSEKQLKDSDAQNKRLRERNEELTAQMNQQMKGIVRVTRNMPSSLPPVPDDINLSETGESLLPATIDQIIQVPRYHPEEQWLYGHVLFDPLLNDARKQHGTIVESGGLRSLLSDALHDRIMSGWFPKIITTPVNANDLAELLDLLGGEGMDALKPPETWEKAGKSKCEYIDGRIPVPVNSTEYASVSKQFSDTLRSQKGNFAVNKVERIQNISLWQSYAVKRQSMITYYSKHAPYHGIDKNGMPVIEKYLFHGTTAENAPKIERRGFDRAFAGRNVGAKLGKGVYFATDSEYSCNATFSTPRNDSVQQMFLSRVAVGDWCKGREGQLTPSPKPDNRLELFDSTVDRVAKPSLFCVFNDAQAYPEYLISFKAITNRT